MVNKSGNTLVFSSNKFLRPEHCYLEFDDEKLPDEKGNKNCFFCVDCENCENCIGCISCCDCNTCTNCKNCVECYNCYDSISCSDCSSCTDCKHCNKCLYCDGLIVQTHSASNSIYNDGAGDGIQRDYNFFPDSGSVLYHNNIESFFLINHFIPYRRPYENVTNYNCHIQWKISRSSKRYWITEQPTENYNERMFSLMEIAMFVFMNKLQYMNWELEAYIKECFNIPLDNSIISNIKPLIDKILVSKLTNSQSIYDEIKTKIPATCIYNNYLYNKE